MSDHLTGLLNDVPRRAPLAFTGSAADFGFDSRTAIVVRLDGQPPRTEALADFFEANRDTLGEVERAFIRRALAEDGAVMALTGRLLWSLEVAPAPPRGSCREAAEGVCRAAGGGA